MKKFSIIIIFLLWFQNCFGENNLYFYIESAFKNNPKLNSERENLKAIKQNINISRSDMRMPAPASSGKDLRSALEKLRKDQNEILLRVLEEERKAEEDRARAARSVPDVDEKNRLELVFAEERRRASERIIQLTKEHEANLKAIVLGPSKR